jgi:hypothetical protein
MIGVKNMVLGDTRDKGTPHVGKDVLVKNHSEATSEHLSHHLISPDVLALVRFGLRDAHDLRTSTPSKS